MQKSSADKESPRKIPLLMLMLSDIKVLLLCVRLNCVFQFFILWLRKPTALDDILNSSKDLRIPPRGTQSNAFMQSIHAELKFCFLFFQLSSIILLTKSWSLPHTSHVYILSVLVERYHFVPGNNMSYLSEMMLKIYRLLKEKWSVESLRTFAYLFPFKSILTLRLWLLYILNVFPVWFTTGFSRDI